MSCIVYITNKKNNTKYAYRSESYRDPITKQPKSRRTYLGRVDPVTNEIIPKAEKGRRNRDSIKPKPVENNKQFTKPPVSMNVRELQKKVDVLQKQQLELRNIVADMDIMISQIQTAIHEIDV